MTLPIVKEKRTLEWWDHFERKKIDDMIYAECNYCKARLKAPSGYGTTNLKKHFEKVCKKRPRKMDIRQSVMMMGSKKLGGGQALETHVFNQEDSRHDLATMVILHDYPLTMVDHIGFRRFLGNLQPCFSMITRNTLKGDIFKIYEVEKNKCYEILDKLNSRIAIKTDM
ncbi:zinc finger BED domain-containing protein DAYSLEEPER-like [Andrographis paniculata]|uniref:zinc finger BED domain-containing protein DAYSLEEPER-like n=1 Tax=Andrographis paniculata TaxID=175694 RepID=UPI0021E91CAD|nr:zinc finger BED domain-containing protein DAYSLEEPER-like [Andrographis paniculata]